MEDSAVSEAQPSAFIDSRLFLLLVPSPPICPICLVPQEWDYFINFSIADIPIVTVDYIESWLGKGTPSNYMSWHVNAGEFRQIHHVPERHDEKVNMTVLWGLWGGILLRGE
jgi:hypothetical protein